MKEDFQLSCESTVDLPFSYVNDRKISVLFYSYMVDDQEYTDDMGRHADALARFYQFIDAGKIPTTSQINTYRYIDYFEELIQRGDVLHIAFGSGMTPSVQNAEEAASTLRTKYPDRKLIVIDSMCSSSGYGLLVDVAADMRDRGCTMEEIENWVLANRKNVHHQFFSTDLQYYRRSGRMSGTAATVAAILGICPIMRLDNTGHIIAYEKCGVRKGLSRRPYEQWNSMRRAEKCILENALFAIQIVWTMQRHCKRKLQRIFRISMVKFVFVILAQLLQPIVDRVRWQYFSSVMNGQYKVTNIEIWPFFC
jgi:DegV family protein with EDD domain